MTHGGMGYSKEVRSALQTPLTQQYHVERCVARACRRLTWIGIYARALCVGRCLKVLTSQVPRLAPISRELILSYSASPSIPLFAEGRSRSARS